MLRVKRIIISLVMSMGLIAPLGVAGIAHAQGTLPGLCEGSNLKVGDKTCPKPGGGGAAGDINQLVTQIINIFSFIVGFVAVIMIIIGGFKYITSGGDSGNVTGAKNTILYAVVGLIVVALAQVIVHFVLGSVNFTKF